jgi:uncharacterized membrane protein
MLSLTSHSLSTLTLLVFALHIASGAVALVAGTTAALATKGGRLHRRAGNIFFTAMIVMAVFAIWLAVVMPDQLVNTVIGTFTLYLVATAWLTVQRKEGTSGIAEKILLAVIVILFAPFGLLAFQLALGFQPFVKSAVPFEGPVLVAVYVFTAVTALAAIADARVVFAGGISGMPRIARHLWRMLAGLTLAAGSAFTNGIIRLVPHAWHVPLGIYFVPQLFVFILLVFWMIRVRFTGWYGRNAPAG